jgi:hypothetical protein
MADRIKIDTNVKIPIKLSTEGREITFLFPPEESKDYFSVVQDFSARGWRLPTARELSLLLTSVRPIFSRNGWSSDIMSSFILHSWDYGLQSCTYLHPSSGCLFVLEDPNLRDLPSEEMMRNSHKALYLPGNYSVRDYYFGEEKEFKFFQGIVGKGLEAFLNFSIKRGFVSFIKERTGPTPKHVFDIYTPENPEKRLYYPVLATSDKLPELNFSPQEKLMFSNQIDRFLKEQKALDKIRNGSGRSSGSCAGYREDYFDPSSSDLERRDYNWENGR